MKKVISLLIFLLIALPISNVFAAFPDTENVLYNVPLINLVDSTNGSEVTEATDGNLDTFFTLNKANENLNKLKKVFTSPHYISTVFIKTSTTAKVTLMTKDGSKYEALNAAAGSNTFTVTYPQVSSIIIENTSTTQTNNIFEVKLNKIQGFSEGLLRGKELKTTTVDGVGGTSAYKNFTDGVMSTFDNPVGTNMRTDAYLTYTFPSLVNVKSFRILTNNTAITAQLLDENNVVIETKTSTGDGSLVSFTNDTTDVKKVRFFTTGNGYLIFEAEAYGDTSIETPTPSPTATPTATPSPTATATPAPTSTPTTTATPTATPKPTATPEQPTGDRAILTITFINGTEKEYDLPMSEVEAFVNWYDARDAGRGPGMYAIDKHSNNKGPFSKRKDYVVFDKILTFEVSEYSAQ